MCENCFMVGITTEWRSASDRNRVHLRPDSPDIEGVQKFIGTPDYLEHKKKRFKSLDHDVARSGAFTIEDENIRKRFEAEYSKTAPLYYRGQIPLEPILARIQKE